MNTAKLFSNGHSQAVRLPKAYRFHTKEVYINKINDMVVLFPKSNLWGNFVKGLDQFTNDYMNERHQLCLEKRKKL